MNSNTIISLLPKKLKARLNSDNNFAVIIWSVLKPFFDILVSNKMDFFKEYTNHGIDHIISVLQDIENITSDETISILTPKEVGVLIMSVILHDIGMQTNTDMFVNMINGSYNNDIKDNKNGLLKNCFHNDRPWKSLWDEYLYDCKFWKEDKKLNVFGKKDYNIKKPNLNDPDSFNEYDKKLIGEFIRIHHSRIAYETAIKGYIGKETIKLYSDAVLDEESSFPVYLQMAGLIARSHGENVRDMYKYLDDVFIDYDSHKHPEGVNIIFLMILVRLADYLQIDSTRVSKTTEKIRSISSPYSAREFETHLSITNIEFDNTDPEKIHIVARPKNAEMFVKIERLIEDIQKEFDLSWAILGEDFEKNKGYQLRYRRIDSNLSNPKVREKKSYVPKEFRFRFNDELTKLLIKPLYGDNSSIGVRELVQNAVDACRERMADSTSCIPFDKSRADVIVKLDTVKKILTVDDQGKGMSLDEIEKYFLTIGSSYSSNTDWEKLRDEKGIFRAGRFGIGVLAAFLLGDTIIVKTRSIKGDDSFEFKASLHDKFIQINKVSKPTYGTSITIHCNDNCVKRLITEIKMGSGHKFWYNWYKDDVPKVEYYCDNVKKNRNSVANYHDLNYESGLFGKIRWKEKSIFGSVQTGLYCNGFYITSDSNKSDFCNDGLKKFFPHIGFPSIQVEDKCNSLPINLQRDNIEKSVQYEFENELAKEVCKNAICQILAQDTAKSLSLPDNRVRQFYFCSEGFSLKSAFTTDFFSGKKLVRIMISKENWTKKTNVSKLVLTILRHIKDQPNYVFFFNRFTLKENVPKMRSGKSFAIIKMKDISNYIMEAEDAYKLYEDQKNNRYTHILHEETDNYHIFVTKEKEIKIMQAVINDCIEVGINPITVSISDIKSEASLKTEFDILINGYMIDPIIPYDFNKRKKKFKKIFDEHSDWIEFWRD